VTQRRSTNSNSHTYRIKFRNKAQHEAFKVFNSHTLTFILGPAGTGKTHVAAASAVKEVFEGRFDGIILTRPLVESQESVGWLPGDLKEKTDPYMAPIFTEYQKAISTVKEQMAGKVRVQPIAYARGHTFEKSICILDEAQNCTYGQLKLYLTRLGEDSKYIVTGDLDQLDIPDSGLRLVIDKLKHITDVEIFEFGIEDIVRHKLVRDIAEAL
jgi:phosphate starvation-inducible PhoH-like protein